MSCHFTQNSYGWYLLTVLSPELATQTLTPSNATPRGLNPVARLRNTTGCMTTTRKQQPMTATQAATLKRLAQDAYEPDAFKPNLTSAEADIRVAMLTAKLKLLGEPPHTL